ncbi:hypothetical protein GCM10010124_17530 [Pilimelia terevasa]|uniref:Uncharacterized protein n=1 Tax=Pilimelia terevasa TaxID=53372 RepID=A0A8J3FHB8_9ACTN|nr:hypothetical protein GCM10010124_17530 [Pilimelia terevasa]
MSDFLVKPLRRELDLQLQDFNSRVAVGKRRVRIVDLTAEVGVDHCLIRIVLEFLEEPQLERWLWTLDVSDLLDNLPDSSELGPDHSFIFVVWANLLEWLDCHQAEPLIAKNAVRI